MSENVAEKQDCRKMSEKFIKDVAFFSGIGKALFLRERVCY